MALNEFCAKYFIIYPFLYLIRFLDLILSMFVSYKYRDPKLPNNDVVLTELTDKADPYSPYRSTLTTDLVRIEDPNTNLYEEFAKAAKLFADHKTMGVREIFSIDDELQPNGKVFKKFSLGKYKWSTYERTYERVNNISNGLLSMGLKSDDKIVLFAETRPDWLVSALACFRIKVPIVTLYATLGIDALTFGINQTNTKYLITSGDQLTKVQKILPKIPTVTHLIVMVDKFTSKNLLEFKKVSNQLKVFTIEETEELGKGSDTINEYIRPKKDDLAVIMYTSGSTGNPKGVMISHGNLLVSLKSLVQRLGTIRLEKDTYVAYLPLAHVLELCCELSCLVNGVRLAYSTPQTIVDTSTAVKRGQKGDLRELKPTVMAAVPVVLERLSKTVYEKLSHTSEFRQLLFKLAYEQKLSCFRAKRSTRLLDRILFRRISKAVVGGKLRLMLSGGALLSKEVHEFVQVCLCPVMQAYGLTETCAGGTSQLPNQAETGIVGSVIPCCELRLVDWPEGGYRATDTPNPRGEIYIGGDNIAMGYYNMPEKTEEDFKVINGVRYFATGDIGEMINGNVKIIDRKKDLVKLSGGEYVSLNKVEAELKLLSFVDNCCVVADPTKSNCVCLICPNQKRLVEILSEEKGNEEDLKRLHDISGLIEKAKQLGILLEKKKTITDKLTKEAIAHCMKQGLDRFEIPTKLKFVKEIWLPDTGLVTDSLKLKRKAIENFYANEIELLYK